MPTPVISVRLDVRELAAVLSAALSAGVLDEQAPAGSPQHVNPSNLVRHAVHLAAKRTGPMLPEDAATELLRRFKILPQHTRTVAREPEAIEALKNLSAILDTDRNL